MSFKRKAEEGVLSEAKKAKPNGNIRSFFAPPKTASSSSKTGDVGSPAVKFDKQKWVEKLTDEQRDLLKLEIDTLHESWLAQLKDDITSKEFLDLKRFLKKELESGKKIFPPMQDVYSWFVSPSSLDLYKSGDLSLTVIVGPAIRHLTRSKSSSWAKIHTTTLTRLMGCASPCARPHQRLLPSRTSIFA
jgi:hypothetical protein